MICEQCDVVAIVALAVMSLYDSSNIVFTSKERSLTVDLVRKGGLKARWAFLLGIFIGLLIRRFV